MCRYDVLLFDLGGVLVDFAGFEELVHLLPPGSDAASVRDRWIHSDAVHRFERGDFDADEFAARFLREWGLDLSPGEFLRSFEDWNRGPYPGAVELLERLGRSHRLACLSNANEMHAPVHRRRLGSLFGRYYFSNELRLAKPRPEIFAHVVADLEVEARHIAYFDDTTVNVEAALRSGMSAFRTDGLVALRRQLQALGFLASSSAVAGLVQEGQTS